MARKVHKLILRKYESIASANNVAINFDFRSGAKKIRLFGLSRVPLIVAAWQPG